MPGNGVTRGSAALWCCCCKMLLALFGPKPTCVHVAQGAMSGVAVHMAVMEAWAAMVEGSLIAGEGKHGEAGKVGRGVGKGWVLIGYRHVCWWRAAWCQTTQGTTGEQGAYVSNATWAMFAPHADGCGEEVANCTLYTGSAACRVQPHRPQLESPLNLPAVQPRPLFAPLYNTCCSQTTAAASATPPTGPT